jgi:hypothetical protein
MNCLKRNLTRIWILPLVGLFFLLCSASVFATYSSLSLSPSSGTITAENTAITVNVDSGTDEFIGIDTNLSFTGSVEYVSATGVERCDSFQVTESTGSINIECFSLSHAEGETYSGQLATLYFKAAGTGTSTFTFTSANPGVSSKTGGSYTLTLDSSTDGTDSTTDGTDSTTNDTTGNLPQTSIFDNTNGVFVAGIFLLLFGFSFSYMYNLLDKALEKILPTGSCSKKSMREKL